MVDEILKAALDGKRIGVDDALELFSCTDMTLLGNVASRLYSSRTGKKDSVVTYIVDRNINYTNVCVTDCSFCAFYRKEGDEDAYVLPYETIAKKIEDLIEKGGRQILLQGGHNVDLKLEYYEELFRKIKSDYSVFLHALSPPEIVHLAKLSRMPVADVLLKLKKAGLDSIPGGGGEILVDRVRRIISPKKCSSQEWLDVMEKAHGLDIRSTATMMFGHVETLRERGEHLERIRELQDKTGGFTAFIAWPFQSANTPLGETTNYKKTSGQEYLKTLAISRVFLDNVDNIQSSWVTQGAKVGQMALYFGANDMGSTMFEENVVSQAGTTYNLDEAEIKRLIVDGGFTPKRRNMQYEWV